MLRSIPLRLSAPFDPMNKRCAILFLALCAGCVAPSRCILREYVAPEGFAEFYSDLGNTNISYEWAPNDYEPASPVCVLRDAPPDERLVHFLHSSGFEFPKGAWVRFNTNSMRVLVFSSTRDHDQFRERFWMNRLGKPGWFYPIGESNNTSEGIRQPADGLPKPSM